MSRILLGVSGGIAAYKALEVIRLATAAGESVIIAHGAKAGTIDAIFAAEPVGTLFLPHGTSIPAWKRWLDCAAGSFRRLVSRTMRPARFSPLTSNSKPKILSAISASCTP